jgi:Cu-Zn family superoxide dismutase
MLVRLATVASLALLCACGRNDAPATAKSTSSKSTAAPSEPAHPSNAVPVTPSSKSSTSSTAKTPPSSTTQPGSEPMAGHPPDHVPGTPTTTPTTDELPGQLSQSTPEAPNSSKPAMPETTGSMSGDTMNGSAGNTANAGESKLVERAVAHVSAASGSQVSGTITFRRVATGVELHVLLDGLTPGEHGLHVHEKGDCSAADATSAGEHFNPANAPHGGRESVQRHSGDFGNVTADGAGHVDVSFTDPHLSMTGDASIVGRAIVVHSGKDDGVSQPSGNSGSRVGCGVIEEDKGTTAGG